MATQIPLLTTIDPFPTRALPQDRFDGTVKRNMDQIELMIDELDFDFIPAVNAISTEVDTKWLQTLEKAARAVLAEANSAESEANALASEQAAALSESHAATSEANAKASEEAARSFKEGAEEAAQYVYVVTGIGKATPQFIGLVKPDNTTITVDDGIITAEQIRTARKLKVALGSLTDATFDGSVDQEAIPVSGTLAVANGGTGQTTIANIMAGKDGSGNVITDHYATKSELQAALNGAVQVVEELPAVGAQGVFYLIPLSQGSSIYHRYIWEESGWLNLGPTSLDLSEYSKKVDTIRSLNVSGNNLNFTKDDGTTGTVWTAGTGLAFNGSTLGVTSTAGTIDLAWNTEVTLGTVGGLAIKAKLPPNPNADQSALVTQNVSTANENHPILLCYTKDATTNQGALTSMFASGVKVNPSTNTITATTFSGALSGNAATATKATQDGSGNVITSTYMNLTGAQTISGKKTFTGGVDIYSGVQGQAASLNIRSNYNADEGGQINFFASDTGTQYNGFFIDNYKGVLRLIGLPSADGTSKTGNGTALNIDVYAKTITGGYTFTGNVTGNCSGTASNVTGTVAIANGGTGSTTRLGALQNLTSESMTTSNAKYFLCINDSWKNGGYLTVANAKTVLDAVTLSDAQTITGLKTFTTCPKMQTTGEVYIPFVSTGFTKANTSQAAWEYIAFLDSTGNNSTGRIGYIGANYNKKNTLIQMVAYRSSTATDTGNAALTVGWDANGNWYTAAPTPANGDVSTKIATTAFVAANSGRMLYANTTIYVSSSGTGDGTTAAKAMSIAELQRYLATTHMNPANNTESGQYTLTICFVPTGSTYGTFTLDANKAPGLRYIQINTSTGTASTTSNYSTNAPLFDNFYVFGSPLHVTLTNIEVSGTILAENGCRIALAGYVGLGRARATNYGRIDCNNNCTLNVHNCGTDALFYGNEYGQIIVNGNITNINFREQCYFTSCITAVDTNGRAYISYNRWKLTGTKPVIALNYGGTKTATCSTAAGTAAKVGTLESGQTFTLTNGAIAYVTFTNTNTAANPTLNINNTGAKPIYFNGAAIPANYICKHIQYRFKYNGSQYVCENGFQRVEVANVHGYFTYNGDYATTYNSGSFNWAGFSRWWGNDCHVNNMRYTNISGNAGTANRVQSDQSTGLFVSSVKLGAALASTSQANFGAIWNANTKEYRVACATWPNSNNQVLLYSVSNANVNSSINTVNQSLVWDAGTGVLSATGGFSGNVTGNCSGTSANVTGTVAIANGGTGATTVQGARKAIFGDAMNTTNSVNFAMIGNNWENCGWLSVANARTVLNCLTALTNVSEMGRYIDLHYDNATAKYDFDARICVNSQGDAAGRGLLDLTAQEVRITANSMNQLRMVQGNYGVIFRNDGGSFYILQTASGSAATGSWNTARPLTINLSNGVCNINGNAATASSCSGNAATATTASACSGNAATATCAATLGKSGAASNGMKFYWSGQSGQPSWLWGGSDGTNMYVYNPSNFSVASAAACTGNAATATKLATARKIWGNSFNGTADINGDIEAKHVIDFNRGTTADYKCRFYAEGDNTLIFGVNSAYKFVMQQTIWRPYVDKAASLGSASERWNVVYASTGSINTSDERMKNSISNIDDALLDAWEDIEYKTFKFNDSVEEKNDAARYHSGVVAQAIGRKLSARGIEPAKYGFYCYDEWGDQYINDVVKKTVDGERVEEKVKVLATKAGNRYSIRYEELFSIEAAYMRRYTKRLEERISELEKLLNVA